MKQVLQNLGNGECTVADVPCPSGLPGTLLIRSTLSLISAGTERMLVDFGRSSLLEKVRQQPDKVKQVIEKARTDGVIQTLEAVRTKLDQPIALGYCNVGRVVELGANVEGFALGDRVVSNGRHAEMVVVPKHLCARVPEEVSDDSASFAVLGAIALQGVRLVQPTIGESVAVIGLGLVGLMTAQILRANGCRVLGIDLNTSRLTHAREVGVEVVNLDQGQDPLAAAATFSRGRGMDAVIITASTDSNEPIAQAAQMARQRGRIVLVGTAGLELSRAHFYEKELTFQVSCSYGPGRYDPAYEEHGHDYPIGFVRWTEQRNLEAVLDLMAAGMLDVRSHITHRFDIDDAPLAYDLLSSGKPSLGILIRYPGAAGSRPAERLKRTVALLDAAVSPSVGRATPRIGFIGAGNYAGRVLIPAFRKAGASLQTLVAMGGVSATHQGRKHGFLRASTEPEEVFEDATTDAVVIATRHDTHARFVIAALAAGKHVFVEKPLCLDLRELEAIRAAYAAAVATRVPLSGSPVLMVGFNRRFAPQAVRMKSLLAGMRTPKTFVMTVNAGAIPSDHWTQDPVVGGGRLVGEACHFIDLLRFLAGAPIAAFNATATDELHGPLRPDNATIVLLFADGSVGTIHYLASGHKSVPKERLEVFCAGRVLQLDDFRKLRGFGWPGFSRMNLWSQEKGQSACASAFVTAVRSEGPMPIPLDELWEVARVSVAVATPEA